MLVGNGLPSTADTIPTLWAPGGRIHLVSVASPGEVGIDGVASAPDLRMDGFTRLGRIDLSKGAVATVGSGGSRNAGEIEVRGPIGRWFVWDGATPAVLIGGGSGVVPLMAMLRLARRTGRSDLLRLVVSVRSPADLYYAAELPGPETTVVYTRAAPPDVARPVGRLAGDDLAPMLQDDATVFVCGSAGFADAAGDLCVALGVPTADIRVERFGPTG